MQELLAGVDPELTVQTDKVRPLGNGRYEMKVAIGAECHRGLERPRGLSHVDPHMTLGPARGAAGARGVTIATTRAGSPAVRVRGADPRAATRLRPRSGARRADAPFRRRPNGMYGNGTEAAAATSTRGPIAAVSLDTCCKSITRCRTLPATVRSRRT